VEVGQLLLHLSEQEEVRWCEIRQIGGGGVLQHLDCSGSQPIFHFSGEDGRVVPVQEQLLLDHLRPLDPEVFHELAQDDDGVVCINGDAPGHDVRVHEPLVVEKCNQHLLGATRCHLGLNRAWRALLNPLF
jgi:hypothetical protein